MAPAIEPCVTLTDDNIDEHWSYMELSGPWIRIVLRGDVTYCNDWTFGVETRTFTSWPETWPQQVIATATGRIGASDLDVSIEAHPSQYTCIVSDMVTSPRALGSTVTSSGSVLLSDIWIGGPATTTSETSGCPVVPSLAAVSIAILGTGAVTVSNVTEATFTDCVVTVGGPSSDATLGSISLIDPAYVGHFSLGRVAVDGDTVAVACDLGGATRERIGTASYVAPTADEDGDGLIVDDECPYAAGPASTYGCPLKLSAAVQDKLMAVAIDNATSSSYSSCVGRVLEPGGYPDALSLTPGGLPPGGTSAWAFELGPREVVYALRVECDETVVGALDLFVPAVATPVVTLPPSAPQQTVVPGPDNDSVAPPAITGVTFVCTPWVNGSMTCTASAASGYALPEGAQTQWTLVDTNTKPPVIDSDGDGVLDDADAFPQDPTESADVDGDGIGDNADACDDAAGPSSNAGCPVVSDIPIPQSPSVTDDPELSGDARFQLPEDGDMLHWSILSSGDAHVCVVDAGHLLVDGTRCHTFQLPADRYVPTDEGLPRTGVASTGPTLLALLLIAGGFVLIGVGRRSRAHTRDLD